MNLKRKLRVIFSTLFSIIIILLLIPGFIQAQDRFIRGIFALDNPSNLHLNADEKQLIYGTYPNFLFGVLNDEASVMIFCRDTTDGNIQMCLERDPTGYSHHVYGDDPWKYYTDQFWPYISRSYTSHIQYSEIDRFISNVDNEYGSDVTGLGMLLISHQGYTGDSGHWPFIQYTCHKIQTTFGDDVKSMVIDNVTRATKPFFAAVDSLDIFCHEQYPIYSTSQGDTVDYTGAEIQTCFTNLVQNYDSCLVGTKNVDTEWHAIIQACEQQYYDSGSGTYRYWRRPTTSELWCQAFLAMSRGAKGVHYYLYMSNVDSTNHPSSPPNNGWEMLGLVTDSREEFSP